MPRVFKPHASGGTADLLPRQRKPIAGSTGLCWKQEPGHGGTGVRCDRLLHHRGLHSWELVGQVEALEDRVKLLERMFAQRG